MIECTALFSDAEWACAHLNGTDLLRINVQYINRIQLVHMRISKIQPFLDAIEREKMASEDHPPNRV